MSDDKVEPTMSRVLARQIADHQREKVYRTIWSRNRVMRRRTGEDIPSRYPRYPFPDDPRWHTWLW